MATLKQIRSRIRTAKNIQQITKAMKLVAAARFKKATDRVLEARPFNDKIAEVMGSITSGGDLPEHDLLIKREVKKIGLIVMTSDRGLAGSYNTNVIRKTSDYCKNSSIPVSLITVGRKANQFFSRRGFSILSHYSMPSAGAKFADAEAIANQALEMYKAQEYDALYICYAKFYSAIRQVPTIVQILPIEPEADQGPIHGGGTSFNFEPNAKALLDTLLPRYFVGRIWQALLESTASEFGARMTAMTSATDNAGKMISNLTLKANRERQASITKEILEVVGGAEALKS